MRKFWDFICILGLLFKLIFVLLERATTSRIIKHFKDKELLEIGTQLSFYYFLAFLIFFGWRIPELYEEKTGINGVGDFLAGLFSPIAFGWLIIGYLMQNKELKNSVEQTGEAQRLARDQLDFQKQSKEEFERLKIKQSQPIFTFESLAELDESKGLSGTLIFTIKNSGAKCYRFQLRKEAVIEGKKELLPIMNLIGGIESEESIPVWLELNEAFLEEIQSNSFIVIITFQDSLFLNRQLRLSVRRYSHYPENNYRLSVNDINEDNYIPFDYSRSII
ncbi:hypothetical protein [Marinomonas sp.]|uniref:hypothetical protein n=1 Tax=Marinomonas sp. TaxID=1904862 RepID=UPI003A8F724F